METAEEQATRKSSVGHKRYRSLDSSLPGILAEEGEQAPTDTTSSSATNPRPVDQLMEGSLFRPVLHNTVSIPENDKLKIDDLMENLQFSDDGKSDLSIFSDLSNLSNLSKISESPEVVDDVDFLSFGVIGRERVQSKIKVGSPGDGKGIEMKMEKEPRSGLKHLFKNQPDYTHKRTQSTPEPPPIWMQTNPNVGKVGNQVQSRFSYAPTTSPPVTSTMGGAYSRDFRDFMEKPKDLPPKKPTQMRRVKSLDRAGGERLRITSVQSSSMNKSKDPVPLLNPEPQNDFEILKRAELIESPSTKSKLNEFTELFKTMEKSSMERVGRFVMDYLKELPKRNHWHVFLILADFMKRNNRFKKAILCYHIVSKLQPFSSQGWLDWAKLEEEHGNTNECLRVLHEGMRYCSHDESIAIRCLRFEESLGHMKNVRQLISTFSRIPIERCWRIVLEGALIEGRAGNLESARRVFSYLLRTVKWYGPIYYEVALFEERLERCEIALKIVLQGLNEIPRYGPLWFLKFRLCEKLGNGGLMTSRHAIDSALAAISKELLWKVHYEHGMLESRARNIDGSRKAFREAILSCSNTHRWKIWLAGSRAELRDGTVPRARRLLERALQEVPMKGKPTVYIEYARLEEYVGNVEGAREILRSACNAFRSEWKIFLAALLLEIRQGNVDLAIEKGWESLKLHAGTGRLWSILAQLLSQKSENLQLAVLWQALLRVPKSGEIWCEAARKHLQPTSAKFDLAKARRCLEFAVKFTPQYGDSFIEYLRLEMLENGMSADTSYIERICLNADPNYGALWTFCRSSPLEGTAEVLRSAKRLMSDDLSRNAHLYQKAIVSNCVNSKSFSFGATNGPTNGTGASENRNNSIANIANITVAAAGNPQGSPQGSPQVNSTTKEQYYHPSDIAMLRFNSLSGEDKFKLIFGFDQVGI